MDRKSFLLSLAGAAGSPLVADTRQMHSGSDVHPVPSRAEQLAQRIFEHNTAAYMVGAAYIGDRLGLFKAMSGAGALTADQLAAKTGLDKRYLYEWLRAMAAGGYLDYHPAKGAFEMPVEHTAVLADEDSRLFCGGLIEGTVPDLMMVSRVIAAFRTGKGIPYGDYPPETFDSLERFTRPEYQHLLTKQWLPEVPGVVERLRAGGATADLGSGAGIASIVIAKSFPQARAFGFEPYAPSVARARQNAERAGVATRVKFETFDGIHVPGGPYDLITINYALHHAGDPLSLVRSARRALAPGGAFLVIELRKSAQLEQDIDSPRRIIYGFGLLECLPTALDEGGPGYGAGIAEPDMRELAQKAGFRQFTRVLADDPMHGFFVLRD